MGCDSALGLTAIVCLGILLAAPFSEVTAQKYKYPKISRGHDYIQEYDRDRDNSKLAKDEPPILQQSYFGKKNEKGHQHFDWGSSSAKVSGSTMVKNERTTSKVSTSDRRSHSFSSSADSDKDGRSFSDLVARLREYQRRRFGTATNSSDTFFTTNVGNGTRTITRIEEHVSHRLLPVGARETTVNRSISAIETPITTGEDYEGTLTESRFGHGSNTIDRTTISGGSRKGDSGTKDVSSGRRDSFSSVDMSNRGHFSTGTAVTSENENRWTGSRTWSRGTGTKEVVKTVTDDASLKKFDSNSVEKDLQEWMRTRNQERGATRESTSGSAHTGGSRGVAGGGQWSGGTESSSGTSGRGHTTSWRYETRGGSSNESKGDDAKRGWSSGTDVSRGQTESDRTREEDRVTGDRRQWSNRKDYGVESSGQTKGRESDARWSSRGSSAGSSAGSVDQDYRYYLERRQWGSRTPTGKTSTESPPVTKWSFTSRNVSVPESGRGYPVSGGSSTKTESRYNRTSTEIYIRRGSGGNDYNTSVSRFYNESRWAGGATGGRGWKYDYDRREDKDRDTKVTVDESGRRPGVGGNHSAGLCDEYTCYPGVGNLLIGREHRLSATSTCGLKKLERFCIVSHLQEKKKCFYCNSLPSEKNKDHIYHGIEKVAYRIGKKKKKHSSWWQSENGVEQVSIRLDLEALFYFTHLIIQFKTFRPAAMLIERSKDFGQTWHVYQYLAYNCEESFPGIPVKPRTRLDEVVCDSSYSGVEPSSGGEVIFKALPPRSFFANPYSDEVLDTLAITNLRINFTKLHTFGDNLLDSREEIKEKYYYAINEMTVRGNCLCHGHATRCIADPELNQVNRPDMVYGKCDCTHNTEGKNCNKCKPFYQDQPWRPAMLKQQNACKMCECHNHATECEFNQTVWEMSGRISGGVCLNCKHHTTGKNCDQCQPFYYEDPGRDTRDPNFCQQCDCDARGSLDDGLCDSKTDEFNQKIAGTCHCKRNVDGRRCDRCKNGFWKFEETNPEGCISCTCDLLGTVTTQGCNAYTGECLCKRNVIGRDCNQCLPEYWGLSADDDGCKPCDCDPGGSLDNNCDVITGRCRCRPNIYGRRCDQPEKMFFSADLDYMVYEAELARGSPDCQVLVREPYPNRDSTWTGLGFMRVFENSYLEFDITDVPRSMEYDVVIRYEPQLPGQWEEATVTIERPGPIDPDGPCANTIPQDDRKRVTLPSGERYIVVFPPACLEEGKNYKIRIEFKQYDSQIDTPSASILIDSIALIPRIDSIPFFQGTPLNEHRRQEYERFRCGQAFYTVIRPAPPDVCKKYLYSIGFYVYGQAHECYCDPTGSVSTACDTLGGQCTCKPNVVGRRCDRCAPGTYGFGPTGCKPCDCNSVGSLDNFCGGHSQTGQCKCRPNTYGRQCDECQPGYWNYPNCQRCDCNGHADTCDSRTGSCIDCRDFTAGPKCDRCETGFYGDPRIGKDISCRPCPCPGTVESGISHASTCELDPRSQNVICLCDAGYTGERCDRCAPNYFGDPTVPGGECKKCNCNNNIDETDSGNCDSRTGECLKCLYNTEGFYCERCKDNFYGDATRQQCLECVCNPLGTDPNGGYCDKERGQCPCLPNVVGHSCDRCADNHWKIASGEGCEACNCDSLGSYSPTCNEYYGQCSCRPGHGGIQCNECEANFWGNPSIQCNPCNCNLNGSTTQQCHRNNGTCICKPGISGDRCDQCARGYTGRAPYCDPCGECFDNWDFIIQRLKEQTIDLLERARTIKQTGVTGVFTQNFMEMEEKLKEVRDILNSTNVTSADIDRLQELIDQIRQELNKTEVKLTGVENEVENTTQRIIYANLTLAKLKKQAAELEDGAKTLKDKAIALQEANIEGALNITRDAQKRSRGAENRIYQTKDDLTQSERKRRKTESLLSNATGAYNKTLSANEDALNKIAKEIKDLEDQVPNINKLVCDGYGSVDTCDSLCGGAGCDMCGGISCNEGAVNKADNAKDLAEKAGKILTGKEKTAKELLNNLTEVRREAQHALDEAKAAYDRAKLAKNKSEDASGDIEELVQLIENFLKEEGARPAEIRDTATKCLELEISLKPEEIVKLAKDINDTIATLTDIDKILSDTKANLDLTNSLKKRADKAKESADDILNTAKRVKDALEEARKAQEGAQKAIDAAKRDTEAAEDILADIDEETQNAQGLSNRSLDDVRDLQNRLGELKKKFKQNEFDAEKAGIESTGAEKLSQEASKGAKDLEDKYKKALGDLDKKTSVSGQAKQRAENLRERARNLAQEANSKFSELREMEDEFDENERILNDYSEMLRKLNNEMMVHLDLINKRSEYYRDCQS